MYFLAYNCIMNVYERIYIDMRIKKSGNFWIFSNNNFFHTCANNNISYKIYWHIHFTIHIIHRVDEIYTRQIFMYIMSKIQAANIKKFNKIRLCLFRFYIF